MVRRPACWKAWHRKDKGSCSPEECATASAYRFEIKSAPHQLIGGADEALSQPRFCPGEVARRALAPNNA